MKLFLSRLIIMLVYAKNNYSFMNITQA